MRLALVGPAHPYKGGIAQHTTALAHRLRASGHDVEVWSWKRQYPQRLYPGEQRVPGSVPEQPEFTPTLEPLSWDRPVGWYAAGRRARRERRELVLSWTTPVQGPAYLGVLAALRHTERAVAMCHNVLPHEAKPWDQPLAKAVLRRCDGILVHSATQEEVAHALAPAVRTSVAALPPPPINRPARERVKGETRTLLMFGLLRPYKGLDVLLAALERAEVPPDVRLIVAGEFWQQPQVPGALRDRVELRPGYVAADDLPSLFAEADAVVLPYRSGTASIVTDIAHGFGVPALVTDVGTLAASTRDGVDGLVVPSGEPGALAAAIARLYDGRTLAALRANVRPADVDGIWAQYVRTLESLLA